MTEFHDDQAQEAFSMALKFAKGGMNEARFHFYRLAKRDGLCRIISECIQARKEDETQLDALWAALQDYPPTQPLQDERDYYWKRQETFRRSDEYLQQCLDDLKVAQEDASEENQRSLGIANHCTLAYGRYVSALDAETGTVHNLIGRM